MAGKTQSTDFDFSNTGYHNGDDIAILKLNRADGNILWKKIIGGSEDDDSYSMLTTEESIIITGYTAGTDGDFTGTVAKGNSDACLFKLRSNDGAITWKKRLGGSRTDYFFDIIATNNGYTICGWTNSEDGDIQGGNAGGPDAWIAQVTQEGQLVWNKTFGSPGYDHANSLVATTEGVVFTGYVSGNTSRYHGNNDFWLVKLDSK